MPDKPTTFTTGQASGLAMIPPKTLARYVKTFPEHFSPEARQPDRGRRYSPQDVKTFILIRHLYSDRKNADDIRAALSGDWMPEALPRYDLENLLTLENQTRAQVAQVEKLAAKMKEMYTYFRGRENNLIASLQKHRDAIINLQEEVRFLKAKRGPY